MSPFWALIVFWGIAAVLGLFYVPPWNDCGASGMTSGGKPGIVIERVYQTSLNSIWDLWTTRPGLESWWGPDGFVAKVRKLDVRPGGEFEYEITATDTFQVEALKGAGLPLTNVAHGTYTEVVQPQRIAYKTLADIAPGVSPYEVATVVEFRSEGDGVRMRLTQDAMHDPQWTRMSAMGLNQQFTKLGDALLELKDRDQARASRQD